jgi:hypothetical protein
LSRDGILDARDARLHDGVMLLEAVLDLRGKHVLRRHEDHVTGARVDVQQAVFDAPDVAHVQPASRPVYTSGRVGVVPELEHGVRAPHMNQTL